MLSWIEEASQKESALNEILSFEAYLDMVHSFPEREIRASCQYLVDMFEHYKKTTGGKSVLEAEHAESWPVYGQKTVEDEIYQNLKNFMEEGFNNKFILLVGPNGSSKSSIVRKLMTQSEEYSKTDEGRLYSFSWVFPVESFVKGNLGLTGKGEKQVTKSYAHLEDKDVLAILTSELRDHPFLLIPMEYRQRMINDFFKNKPQILDVLKKSYLYHGDVSKKNRMIYDALLRSHKGNHREVLKHIRVERFNISKRYSVSAATIEPQLHQDARLNQITMDRRLASLPPGLQSLNLFVLQGEVIMANRGILEFSDLLKRPLDTYKYLLMTMETRSINLQGILTELDIFFVGTSNEVHLSAFKQHPDFNSFKGRFNFIRVPYLLDYTQEMKIYVEQVQNLLDKTLFSPLSLELLCLFAVMTRIRPPQEKNYSDKNLGKVAASLSPLEKALFLGEANLPDRLSLDEKQILRIYRQEVLQEYENDGLYEGKFGISPRTMKHIIYELSGQYGECTFVDLMDYLTKFVERKNEHEFLNTSAQGEYHNPARFLELLKIHGLNLFEDQVRESLGLVEERSYEEYLGRYVHNISAIIKRDKIKNNITGKFEEPDAYFVKEFETNIKLQENVDSFRSHLIGQLGAYSLDRPGKPIIYTEVFPNLVKRLQQSFREEQKKKIQKISTNLVFFLQEMEGKKEGREVYTGLTPEARKEIAELMTVLQSKYKYSEKGALSLLQFLIKGRY